MHEPSLRLHFDSVQNEVKAWITIGGEQVPEYRPHFDETSGERRVFIEAIAGKEFAVGIFDILDLLFTYTFDDLDTLQVPKASR